MIRNLFVTISCLVLGMLMAEAKVTGFNAMIKENLKQQENLRADLSNQIQNSNNSQITVVDRSVQTITTDKVSNDIGAYNPSTPKGMLTFKKERSQYRASTQKQQDRLAEEIKDLDTEF